MCDAKKIMLNLKTIHSTWSPYRTTCTPFLKSTKFTWIKDVPITASYKKIDLVDFKFLQINFLKINISNSEQWMYFSSLTPAWAEPSSKNNTISYICGIQIIINYNYVLLTRKIIHIYGANWHILHYTLEYLNWRFVYVTNRLNSCGQNQANQLSLQRHSHHLK